jgi:creatinine amidohydrolase
MNMPSSRFWADLPWTEFADLPPNTVAILPIAAIEQHGPHLPVAVDTAINQGLVRAMLAHLPEDVPALVLPTQAIGCSVEHIRFAGTLTSRPETLIALWTEIGESVARAGVRRLLLLNSHGGQPQIADIVCRRLRASAGLFAVNCMWSRLGRPPGVALTDEEARHGIHGGLVETSMMLHLCPELVRMARAKWFRSRWLDQEQDCSLLMPEGATGFGWETQDLNPEGALGDAASASAALGERFTQTAAAHLSQLIQEMARLDVSAWLGS